MFWIIEFLRFIQNYYVLASVNRTSLSVLGIFLKIFTITNSDVTPAIDVLLYLSLFNESRWCHNLAWQCKILPALLVNLCYIVPTIY